MLLDLIELFVQQTVQVRSMVDAVFVVPWSKGTLVHAPSTKYHMLSQFDFLHVQQILQPPPCLLKSAPSHYNNNPRFRLTRKNKSNYWSTESRAQCTRQQFVELLWALAWRHTTGPFPAIRAVKMLSSLSTRSEFCCFLGEMVLSPYVLIKGNNVCRKRHQSLLS